tara:strand:+ start:226 stop:612 length:387 start_codon:yes stop_codon:yes gene_type:complete
MDMNRWVEDLNNLFADLTTQQNGVHKKLNEILTEKEISHLVTLRQSIGLATDVDFDSKGILSDGISYLNQYAENLGVEYLRGILTGILLCLEADSRDNALMFGRLHYEMLPFYDAVYSMMLEKSASDL